MLLTYTFVCYPSTFIHSCLFLIVIRFKLSAWVPKIYSHFSYSLGSDPVGGIKFSYIYRRQSLLSFLHSLVNITIHPYQTITSRPKKNSFTFFFFPLTQFKIRTPQCDFFQEENERAFFAKKAIYHSLSTDIVTNKSHKSNPIQPNRIKKNVLYLRIFLKKEGRGKTN